MKHHRETAHKHVHHYKKQYLASVVGFVSACLVLITLFAVTRGSHPQVSELAFVEHSTLGKEAGSIVPASCESGVDHGVTQTCWDNSVISACSTCPAAPSCPTGYSGTYPNCVAPSCPAGYTGTYPNCVAPTPSGCGAGTLNDTCACPAGYTGTYPNCVAPAPGQTCTTTTYHYDETQPDGCTVKSWDSDNTVCQNPTSSTWAQKTPFTYNSSACTTPNSTYDTTYNSTYDSTYDTTYDSTYTTVNADSPIAVTPSTAFNYTFTSSASDGSGTYCQLLDNGQRVVTAYQKNIVSIASTSPAGNGRYPNFIKCKAVSDASATGIRSVYVDVCPSGYGWSSSSCVAMPDLTAGPVTPTTASSSTSVAYKSTISNTGLGDALDGFYNVMQYSPTNPDTDPNANISTQSATRIFADVSSGGTVVVSSNKAFASGIYYMRFCADKRNRSDSGQITEVNENNNCNPWTPITVDLPKVVNPILSGNHTSTGTFSFSCINSTNYKIIRDGTTISNSSYTGPVSKNITVAGNYTAMCINGTYSDSYVVLYDPTPANPSNLSLTGTPRTIESGGKVTLSWSINNPTNSCKITATPVCTGTCTSAQTSAAASLQTTLNTGSTDSNDPNGSRTMSTALHTVISGTKALGKKTIQINYTTDFGLNCGTTTATSSVRVLVSTSNEG
jgi:hypothetical protein